jgi:hypothetical protein
MYATLKYFCTASGRDGTVTSWTLSQRWRDTATRGRIKTFFRRPESFSVFGPSLPRSCNNVQLNTLALYTIKRIRGGERDRKRRQLGDETRTGVTTKLYGKLFRDFITHGISRHVAASLYIINRNCTLYTLAHLPPRYNGGSHASGLIRFLNRTACHLRPKLCRSLFCY